MARCSRSRWCRTSSSVASASSVLTSSTIRLSTLTASHSRDLAAGEHCAVPMTSSSRLNTSPLRLLYWYASSVATSSECCVALDDDDRMRPPPLFLTDPPTAPPSLEDRREPLASDGADDLIGDVSVVSADVFESMRSSRGFRSTCTPGLYTGREPKEVCRAPCTRSAALVAPRMEFPRLVDGSEAESPPPPPALVPAARSALLPTRLSADATGLASTRGSCLIAGDLART
mmetsp:Transcript_4351/g.19472  ORF Transcript_4351/g.19472 Transcript_4351/m.19472 type:complete len:231 (-) Transcript_4351:230-922(-)